MSRSQTASLTALQPGEFRPTHEYLAAPNDKAPPGFETHFGTSRLTVEVGPERKVKSIKGDYYTERNRGSFGHLVFDVSA